MARRPTNKFKNAVLATPEVKDCFQQGLKAMGRNSNKVILSDTRKVDGSLDVDTCVSRLYPNENRWDYVLGYNGKAYFIEIHPAQTSEVNTVLQKFKWLKDWLNSKAPEINKIKAKNRTPYYWIQSGRFKILKKSRQYRQLVEEGVIPIPILKL
jgi:hypothetical protein